MEACADSPYETEKQIPKTRLTVTLIVNDERREPMSTEAKCPFTHIAGVGRTNRDWWPNRLRLELLY